MNSALNIQELHINPTYAVCIPQRNGRGRSQSLARKENEINLLDNSSNGTISRKAARKLSNAVNWLVASAKNKTIYEKSTSKKFSFKVNFVTLTLPSGTQEISDHHFKSKLLHNFINVCNTKFQMTNYVWKVETQANGNIHAHFTTDTFIHWKDLRKVWNRILFKHGLIDNYTKKYSNMTFADYTRLHDPKSEHAPGVIEKRFQHGIDTEWKDPNTTDVHAVHSVKDLAAYLAKYMSKKEEDRRPIKGRLWSCSANLSSTNKLVLELHSYHDDDLIRSLCVQQVKYKPIESIDKITKIPYRIGEIFFFKISDWGTAIKGRITEEYNKHRFAIRNTARAEYQKSIQLNEINQPNHFAFEFGSTGAQPSWTDSNQINISYV
jgi:hypothetical protein